VASEKQPWGRVGDDGTVYVRTPDGERAVGQYPDGDPAEAIAYYERKFADLESEVSLLEQRVRRGMVAETVLSTITELAEQIRTAPAVGDLESLAARVERLGGSAAEAAEAHKAELAEARQRARQEREALVAEAEALAAQDLSKVQWRTTTQRLDELFARWQELQKSGPRLSKSDADALWKRFSAARRTLDTARRAFFAQLETTTKQARSEKLALIEQAEALGPRGADGVPAYRELLEKWKKAGRSGRKSDDALWERFKAAGDVLFAAKASADALVDEEYGANLRAKEELLAEGEAIRAERDPAAARAKLTALQRRWDAIGRVPRDRVRAVEDRMRSLEAAVRAKEDEHWRANNPETQARVSGVREQLEAIIADLEQRLEDAKARKDAAVVKALSEELEARRSWLSVMGG